MNNPSKDNAVCFYTLLTFLPTLKIYSLFHTLYIPYTCTGTGIPNPPSVSAYLHQTESGAPGRHHSLSDMGKDALSSQAVISVTEHLFDILEACGELYEDCKWTKRWQRLSRRYNLYSFLYSFHGWYMNNSCKKSPFSRNV